MWKLTTIENMKKSEESLISASIPSLELMRRAGLVLYHAIRYSGNVAILVGKGNNGGDGFALASQLASHDLIPSIYKVSDVISDDAYYFEAECKRKNVPIMPYVKDLGLLDDVDIIVDCLFGTGLKGAPTGLYASAIKEINAAKGKVVSCDINSGFNGNTGPTTLAVKSDITIAINTLKIGTLRKDYRKYISALKIGDIGIPLLKDEDYLLDLNEWNNIQEKEIKTDEALNYFIKDTHRYFRKPSDLEIKEVSYLASSGQRRK